MELQLIHHKIHSLRGYKVILDFDLSALYEVETKRLKEAVRRNIERFPEDFMFVLTQSEFDSLRTQFASLKNQGRGKHLKYPPYAFTEQGISMISSVLHSEKAIQMNISIMRAFMVLRRFVVQYDTLADQIAEIRQHVSNHHEQLNLIYDAIENILEEKTEQKTWAERQKIGFIK